jgi:hypothetical protein
MPKLQALYVAELMQSLAAAWTPPQERRMRRVLVTRQAADSNPAQFASAAISRSFGVFI